ncbi:hypothetical protein TPA0907_11790 [Micromonospora humidisoli]|uniref:Uncharacterized protein n=1 Tax=Micromonospora humidisoli TaxID=2807622 RepID=A0ABS2JBN3_9ACTN|nr:MULTISPECIES: hypothetical protein [Micromonospora]MBM7083963.1 hypothetical protein [Micromonospora humidisoli]GHJ06812.1 hypothetical protein TPA0907_11790 [Micromonospora sp. AKA109]
MPQVRSSRFIRLLAAGAAGAAVVAALPAVSAQAGTAPINVSVKGGYNNSQSLGTATGTVTGTGSNQASYSVTLCGQSTYPSSQVTIKGGTATAYHTVYYQNCETFTGDLVSNYGFTNIEVTVSGSTFYPGNQYTTYTKTRTIYF